MFIEDYNLNEITEFIKNGGVIIKHPLTNKYLVKGRKEDIVALSKKVDIIVCEKENNLNQDELASVFDDLTIRYKIKRVLFSFHPLLVTILLVVDDEDEIDIEDIINVLTSRTSIVRGIISINGHTVVPFSNEVSMESKEVKDIKNDERAITKDDIINLRILLETTKSVDELISKL